LIAYKFTKSRHQKELVDDNDVRLTSDMNFDKQSVTSIDIFMVSR